jgi:O-antigen/teichoic acid export membrane protein
MGLGLFMFRMLYQGLGLEEFGYWSLLWSVFGYGILLDFGFGFAAVKKVAELSVHEKWDELSQVLSTIFYLYVCIGIGIIVVVLLGSHQIINLFNITSGNKEYFRQILVWFLCGMAVALPLGIFPEILMGQQRMALVNWIFAGSTIANFIGTAIALHYRAGLMVLVAIALITAILPCIIAGLYAIKLLPHIKIHPNLFSKKMVRITLSFSIYAYVSTVSNIILGKTDQLVISTALTVSAVALYQAGSKIGEMFGQFTTQLPDTFSPAAAHLHAKGDRSYLQRILLDGTRFSVMIATPGYLICAFYMEGILQLLTGGKDLGPETYWVAQVLLLWQYVTVITQSVQKRVFMMCGHERKLMWMGMGEAALNLALSIGLVLIYKNVVCVALGSLIATSFFGWFYIWPWAAREAGLSGWSLVGRALVPIWLSCLPLLLFLVVARFVPWMDVRGHPVILVVECAVAGCVGLLGLWHKALSQEEKEKLSLKFGKFFVRGTTPV